MESRQKTLTRTRRSYTREQKLDVLRWYTDNGQNLYRTCQKFDLNTKTVLRWIKSWKAIHDSKKGRKRVSFDRTAEHPGLEEVLYEEYRKLRQRGLKVKGWWFQTRGKQLLESISPGDKFKFSNQWFHGFKKRYNISLRRPTHKAQVIPSSKSELIQSFHRDIRAKAATGNQLGPLGRFRLSCIANVDQTPLPFTFTNGPTYESKGAKTVWVQGGSSGLDKRQCTVQLTLFADGVPRVKPLVIFRGTGKRITFTEKLRYDRRVGVRFQENAWCDEPTMIYWVKRHWKPHVQGPTLLCLDQHKAQKTPSIESLLAVDCNTTTALIPPGCTSLVQPLDVVFNAPFKRMVDDLATAHMQEHLDDYVHGNFSARDRRVLLTKWIGEAWEKTCANDDMVVRAFKKCGISVAINGSEDEEININNRDDYVVGSNTSDEDPFTDSDHEMSTTESEISTSDEGDNETSEREDIDTIDLCSDESDDDCTINRSVMPEDFVTIPETFTMMPGYLELPEPEDIIQEPAMSFTSSEDL